MLKITRTLSLAEDEIDIGSIRAQGAGGQNVNKVASAIHLRFDIRASSLPDACKERLLQLSDRRITGDGVVIIKAQRHRSREKNQEDAFTRLVELIQKALHVPKTRTPTRPTRSSKEKRLQSKTHHSRVKAMRSNKGE